MKHCLPAAALVAALTITAAHSQTTKPVNLPEGTRVVIVGKISSPPKGGLGEQKMQIAVGPQKRDYTIHFRNGIVRGFTGKNIDEDGLDDGMWVRAEGTVMDDPRRIRASGVRVAKLRGGHMRGSVYYRRGFPQGYVTVVKR